MRYTDRPPASRRRTTLPARSRSAPAPCPGRDLDRDPVQARIGLVRNNRRSTGSAHRSGSQPGAEGLDCRRIGIGAKGQICELNRCDDDRRTFRMLPNVQDNLSAHISDRRRKQAARTSGRRGRSNRARAADEARRARARARVTRRSYGEGRLTRRARIAPCPLRIPRPSRSRRRRVSAIAARKSSVVAREPAPAKCSRSNARWAALRAAHSMSAGVKSGLACDEDGTSTGSSVDLADIAGPDGGASLVVRRADGKHVVESPRSEEAGSSIPTELVAHTRRCRRPRASAGSASGTHS